jgi:hypothetical protein
MFSGSYHPKDVIFLLKPVRLETTDRVEKERLIQSGQRHYSEMISPEELPSPDYLRVFQEALGREKSRLARDLLLLARRLAQVRSGAITLLSLARAGTPVGVLLGRALRQLMGRHACHYSLSIIRDRGLDEVALHHVLNRHPADSIVFVDGWTGKGVIARELKQALARFHARHGVNLDPSLWVVADLCGAADFAATAEDYLIPSSVLGATISGLVSRSILNKSVIGPGDFHGCLYYEEFTPHDLSRSFVDELFEEMKGQAHLIGMEELGVQPADRVGLRAVSAAFLADVQKRLGVGSIHHVKPGLGEATRVLLRRVPGRLLLRNPIRDEVAHLLILAQAKEVPVLIDPTLPYAAVALIQELDG